MDVTVDQLSANDTYVPAVAVAALDLLGVNALVAKADRGLAAMNALSRFVRNASSRAVYEQPDLTSRHERMYDLDLYFGDSLYLFADPSRDIDAQIQWLLVRVATMVGLGLWSGPRFLVRGAIAVGDLRKRIIQADGTRHEVRIGTAMTAAHRLQEGQDWIGAAVDGSAPLNAEARKWTADYPVPLKSSCKLDCPPVATNWVWSNGTLEQVEQELLAAVRETGPVSAVPTKLANTLEFVNSIFAGGQLAPFERNLSGRGDR